MRKLLGAFAAAAGATVLMASPAAAAVNDNFSASTTNGCGAINFVDFGPGAPGGGDNDDYLVIHDYCSDAHGVMGYTWLNGVYLGSKYNGNGLAGAAVVWDPTRLSATYSPRTVSSSRYASSMELATSLRLDVYWPLTSAPTADRDAQQNLAEVAGPRRSRVRAADTAEGSVALSYRIIKAGSSSEFVRRTGLCSPPTSAFAGVSLLPRRHDHRPAARQG